MVKQRGVSLVGLIVTLAILGVLFVMGANAWRDEQEWPLARAVGLPFGLVIWALVVALPSPPRPS